MKFKGTYPTPAPFPATVWSTDLPRNAPLCQPCSRLKTSHALPGCGGCAWLLCGEDVASSKVKSNFISRKFHLNTLLSPCQLRPLRQVDESHTLASVCGIPGPTSCWVLYRATSLPSSSTTLYPDDPMEEAQTIGQFRVCKAVLPCRACLMDILWADTSELVLWFLAELKSPMRLSNACSWEALWVFIYLIAEQSACVLHSKLSLPRLCCKIIENTTEILFCAGMGVLSSGGALLYAAAAVVVAFKKISSYLRSHTHTRRHRAHRLLLFLHPKIKFKKHYSHDSASENMK